MNGKKIGNMIIVTLLFLFLVPLKANADDCSYKEINRLQELAGKIKVSYEHENQNVFNFVFKNVSDELYLKDTDGGSLQVDLNTKSNTITGFGYTGGKTYTFYVFPVITSPCVDEKLRTIYVNPPKFNEYANFQACIENPDFSLCKKWANTQGVTEEQFYKRLDDYKKKEAQKQPNGKEEKKQNAMLSFLKNYYWVVLLFIIIGGGTVIGVVKWKEKYDQDRGKKL